ncbi:hypothetical protein ACM43_01160 [Bradyrhizobium sp. CCBAU 45321]|nr:hypothetical protein [Bradyrhizobium sp. CCBAU 45321]
MNATLRPSGRCFLIKTTRHGLNRTPAEDNLVPAPEFIRARIDEDWQDALRWPEDTNCCQLTTSISLVGPDSCCQLTTLLQGLLPETAARGDFPLPIGLIRRYANPARLDCRSALLSADGVSFRRRMLWINFLKVRIEA